MIRKRYGALGLVLVVAVVAVASALFFAGLIPGTQGGSGTTARGDLVPAQEKAAGDSGAMREGIDVHGAWTIDVLDADGRLVSHNEFENALDYGGPPFLANVLARTEYPGPWGILIGSSSGTKPCVDNSLPTDCVIEEPGAGNYFGMGISYFHTLTLTPSTADFTKRSLVLQGTAIAQEDGTIDVVQSLDCVTFTPDPATCVSQQAFTARTLSSPVTVAAGQQVLVTVTISFS